MDHKNLLVWSTIVGLGAGCSGSSATQTPTDTVKGTLQIRTMMDYTGPTSDNAAVYYQGIKDAMVEANAQGGIKGWKLDEQFYDHAYVLDRARAKFDEWKADPSWPSVLMLFSWGTPDTQMFSAEAAQYGKPFISGSYANTLATPVEQTHDELLPGDTQPTHFKADAAPFNFFAGTDYGTQARVGMEFVKKRMGKKVAFAYCRESPFCAEPIPAGRTWAKQIGLEPQPVTQTAPDGTTQDLLNITLSDDYPTAAGKVKAYMDAHPDVDWYWVGNSITTSLYVAKALREHTRELGKPDDQSPKVIANMWGMDERAWSLCGADCAGNTFVVMSFASYGDLTAPGMDQVVALHDKYRALDKGMNPACDKDPLNCASVRYVQGYVSFLIFQRALEQVIDHGKEITGANLKTEFESFRNLESGGLTAPISFTSDDHRPTNRVRIYSMNQYGKFQYEDAISVQLQTDWMGW